MRKILVFAMLFMGILWAKNEVEYFDLKAAFESEDFKMHLNKDIVFKFGSNSGKDDIIVKPNLTSNKKASFSKKATEESCQRALLNALISFQNRAIREGGTKVVNLTGFYYKQPFDITKAFLSRFSQSFV